MKTYIALAAVAVLVSGCSTVQDQVKNDRPAAVADCVARVNISQQKFKDQAAAYMGVSKERMPELFCNRLAQGVADSRINQSDINSLIATGRLTAKFRFLKG